jgi:hypothetical protein
MNPIRLSAAKDGAGHFAPFSGMLAWQMGGIPTPLLLRNPINVEKPGKNP